MCNLAIIAAPRDLNHIDYILYKQCLTNNSNWPKLIMLRICATMHHPRVQYILSMETHVHRYTTRSPGFIGEIICMQDMLGDNIMHSSD